ncbi:MAG: 4Fe-4S dicluster domain-containing protein [Candidatus Firestonebacteria bacterium]|nr:4Fe-4S dicluster domain-containing protein [Candidatus Firestonebacteria bacterium]
MGIKINIKKCTGEGTCVTVCPVDPNVFEIKDGKARIINPEACIECGTCVESCPEKCLILEE